jgi:hypothetical protein
MEALVMVAVLSSASTLLGWQRLKWSDAHETAEEDEEGSPCWTIEIGLAVVWLGEQMGVGGSPVG